MRETERTGRFWLGNVILGIALVVLLFMGSLWEWLGIWAMGVWAALAATGAYLVATDRGDSPTSPD